MTNPMFLIIVVSIIVQIIFVQFFGNYTKTAGLSLTHWGISVAIGAGSVPLGVLMRFIPVKEDDNTFMVTLSAQLGHGGQQSGDAESKV